MFEPSSWRVKNTCRLLIALLWKKVNGRVSRFVSIANKGNGHSTTDPIDVKGPNMRGLSTAPVQNTWARIPARHFGLGFPWPVYFGLCLVSPGLARNNSKGGKRLQQSLKLPSLVGQCSSCSRERATHSRTSSTTCSAASKLVSSKLC
jgi:hypothetical protein